MKPITEQPGKKAAFTIVELLIVMTIIVVLISIIVPSLNMAKRHSNDIKQTVQFHSIGAALELFSNNWGGYPPSGALDEEGEDYCGAMKLCEALVGQDLMGFHPNSRFKRSFEDGLGIDIYASPTNGFDPATTDPDNLKFRKNYLELENANAYRLQYLYGTGAALGSFNKTVGQENGADIFVLCDVYNTVKHTNTGKNIGMPILYYKADTSGFKHDPNAINIPEVGDNEDYIYNYTDNDELVALGPPPHHAGGSQQHPLYGTGTNFYELTKDNKIDIPNVDRPVRPDSYILISAGFDGIYGTNDDITNF